MFGKVNPAPAVSKSIRIVFWSLLEPLKPFKTFKTIQKQNINKNLFFSFFHFFLPIGPVFGPCLTLLPRGAYTLEPPTGANTSARRNGVHPTGASKSQKG